VLLGRDLFQRRQLQVHALAQRASVPRSPSTHRSSTPATRAVTASSCAGSAELPGTPGQVGCPPQARR
jgi:hypothetical protein